MGRAGRRLSLLLVLLLLSLLLLLLLLTLLVVATDDLGNLIVPWKRPHCHLH